MIKRRQRCNKHTYCGMNLIFNDNGTLTIEMKSYLQEALDEFPNNTSKKPNIPVATHLFDIIQASIAFLPTRVTKLNIDDWKKLQKLLCYIRGTMNLLLTLGINSFNSIKWQADASYATHSDMKSHTGATMSLA
jgi:hypothetical protein